jgi:hypothetical protein
LDEFNAILKCAPKVADWLPNAMLLALVSGQDRSTIARWEKILREERCRDIATIENGSQDCHPDGTAHGRNRDVAG